ncbi:GH92 family glycosyl hydrolase [Flavobacteriales bacterium]|nr:GH92 family glycosyl hydrolase [Flavobacteriales bacterium]
MLNKRINIFLVCFIVFLNSCSSAIKKIEFVDPFIGTGGHGHTFPGSTAPFGMVQLSPDTRIEGWDGCSGYHFSDSVIYGFSHTHLSGTGVGDYCDLLLMPTSGAVNFNNGYNQNNDGYSSKFNKSNEFAEPGFYNVLLNRDKIDVSLTCTERVGVHKYDYSENDTANVIIDLEHRDQLLDWSLEQVSSTEIKGHRVSRSWAQEQHFYFYLQTSSAINFVDYFSNDETKPTKIALRFTNLKDNSLMLKVGISAVSIQGAKANLNAEANHWDFNKYKENVQDKWEKALSKIEVNGDLLDQNKIFYTALYHSMIAPNIFNDVNGFYRGTDLQVHQSEDNTYTIFSLWDTFRATHPLYTIIEQKKTKEFINTFLKNYLDGGQLPIWELSANYTGCMIGYHVVSVIYDALVKGIELENEELLLEAMLQVAQRDDLGIPEYRSNGFIPAEKETESVSKTLEYSYNDWCIAMMAKRLNKTEIFNEYISRAQSYKNCFNPANGFMQSKVNGGWQYGFIPSEVNFNFTEANSWQYSMFVPHDINGLIELHGGVAAFESKLDQLFETNSSLTGREQSDITGLIGQYAHGNEPSHHMAYLYNYLGNPAKTQKRVYQIMNEQYSSKPDGLSGNEDCGQMSSWYVLSALGFYSVTPGLAYYTIGTPLFNESKINLENGNQFKIVAKRQNHNDFYVVAAFLNGIQLEESYLSHKDIMNGGELILELGSNPNSEWGRLNVPVSEISKDHSIVPVPYFSAVKQSFVDSLKVELAVSNKAAKIYFNSNSDTIYRLYTAPFYISKSESFNAYSYFGNDSSKTVLASYFKTEGGRSLDLKSTYSNQYNAGGDNALINGLKGPDNFMTGYWQGFHDQNFEAVVDYGKVKPHKYISIGALQDIKSWIWFPKKVAFSVSLDGNKYKVVAVVENDFPDNKYGSYIKDFDFEFKNETPFRFLKVEAENYGNCPEWHLGSGGKTWLFFDEITVN